MLKWAIAAFTWAARKYDAWHYRRTWRKFLREGIR
jgi:hypothetical protein